MTWTKSVTLWCDADDCDEWIRTSDSTVGRTRERASGWTCRDGDDFCPDCSD